MRIPRIAAKCIWRSLTATDLLEREPYRSPDGKPEKARNLAPKNIEPQVLDPAVQAWAVYDGRNTSWQTAIF